MWSVESKVSSVECRNTAPATQKSIPYTADLNQMLRLPRKMTMEVSKVLRLPRKLQLIVPNNAKVLRVPTTKRLLARHETCWNVTKCHPCHAKQSYATLGVNATSSELSEHTLNMPQPPDPQSEMATWPRIRENNLILPLS